MRSRGGAPQARRRRGAQPGSRRGGAVSGRLARARSRPRRARPASPASARRSRRAATSNARRRWSPPRGVPEAELVEDPAALRTHRPPVRRRRRAARLSRTTGRHLGRHARRGARGDRSRGRAAPRRSHGASAAAAGRHRGRPHRRTRRRDLGPAWSCCASRRAPATLDAAARILERAAEVHAAGTRDAARPRSRRAGRRAPATSAWARSCWNACAPARPPTNPSGDLCSTTTSACAIGTAWPAWWRRRCRCCPTSRHAISSAWRSPGCVWRKTAVTASAAEVLQDVLLEEPAQAEALSLLVGYYESIGSESDLVDLLVQAFDAAIGTGDPAMVVAAAIRLGGVLERTDTERAAEIYERALTVAPRRGELLRRLLALRPAGEATREQAELMEAVLDVETGAAGRQAGPRAGGRLDDPGRRGGRAAGAPEGLRAGAGDGRVLHGAGTALSRQAGLGFARRSQRRRGRAPERRRGGRRAVRRGGVAASGSPRRRARRAGAAPARADARPAGHPNRRAALSRPGGSRRAARRGRGGPRGAGGRPASPRISACRCTCCARSWRPPTAITARLSRCWRKRSCCRRTPPAPRSSPSWRRGARRPRPET